MKIGTVTSRIAAQSMNIPIRKTMPIIIISTSQRFRPEPTSTSATTSPPPMDRNTVEKNLPPINSIITMEVVFMVAKADSRITVQLNLRLKIARINAPSAPSAAASVGVATPARIVPITARINAIGGMSDFRVNTSFCMADHLDASSLVIGGPSVGLIVQRTKI